MLSPGADVFAWRDEMRTFNCTTEGEPTPDVTWFRNNEYLRSNGTYIIHGRRHTSTITVRIYEKDTHCVK